MRFHSKYFTLLIKFVMAVCFTVILSIPIAQKLNEFWILNTEWFDDSTYKSFIVLFICFLLSHIYLLYKNYVPSLYLILITFLIGIVIWKTTQYDEDTFTASNILLKVIFILLIFQINLFLNSFLKVKISAETKGFISDAPIPVEEKKKSNFFEKLYNKWFGIEDEKHKSDNKGYEQYAQNVANKIKVTHCKEAFAIGINGKWGSGKTSMSNLVKRHLKDEKNIVTIDFKPWNSNTPDAIIKDFFETLQDELSQYHAALSRLLIRYSRKLTSIDSNIITQTIEYAANYILDLDATNKVYDKINKALKDINKKLIIYIDDLDRLQQSEIMEVIRLIRNTANFYNTFFIVTYDKDYVNNALEKADIHNHEKFLEKIFQMEVNLPRYNKFKLIKELGGKLKELFPDVIDQNAEKEIFKESREHNVNILDDWLESSRDVTRLCNGLILNYPIVKDYVIFKEFLLAEILRINYPTIYKDLSDRRDEFLELSNQRFRLKIINHDSSETNSNQNVESTKFYLENYLSNLKLNPKEQKKIFSLISFLFSKRQYDNLDSIIRENRFFVYFNYVNFDGLLSYVEFIRGFKKNEKQFFSHIKDWVQLKLGWQVSQYLAKIYGFEKKEELEKYLRGLIIFHDSHPTVQTLKDFLHNIKNKVLIKKFYNNNPEKMMESIFQPLSKNDIKIKLYFIKFYDNEKIFQNTFILLFDTLIKNSSKFNYEMSVCVDISNKFPEIKDVTIGRIRKFILEKDNFRYFLLSTLFSNSHHKANIRKENIENVFSNLTEFEELLRSRKKESKYVKEYLDLYTKCKQSNFQDKDKFDFTFRHFSTIEEWKKGL